VTGGTTGSGVEKSTEVIDLSNPQKTCVNLSPYPGTAFRSVAGKDKNNQLVVCGGLNPNPYQVTSSCFTLSRNTGSWISSSPLTLPRSGAAYTQVTSNIGIDILVAGGVTGGNMYGYTCSVEGLNTQSNTWTSTYFVNNVVTTFAPLTGCADRACMLQLNSTHFMFTGGYIAPGNIVK
jgi:hypothetical protein